MRFRSFRVPSTVHFNLVASAHAAMLEHGFQPDFSSDAQKQLAAILADPPRAESLLNTMDHQFQVKDLRGLLWSSIDNDTSKDLDQIEFAERLDGGIRVLVGVADVSGSVEKNTPLDKHAAEQTKTVY